MERSEPPTPEEIAGMNKLIADGMRAGFLLGVEGCLPSAAGARVRIDAGRVTVIDGPFTESKEVVGGFALLQFNSKAEALEYTGQFLKVMGAGECEVRQLFEPPTSSRL
ncbi:MAG: YciI family protein [Bryobacteraceae bacterium]